MKKTNIKKKIYKYTVKIPKTVKATKYLKNTVSNRLNRFNNNTKKGIKKITKYINSTTAKQIKSITSK